MADRLMTSEELKLVTGKQRYSKQAEWFLRQFNFDPPRSRNNAVVITWGNVPGLAGASGRTQDHVVAERPGSTCLSFAQGVNHEREAEDPARWIAGPGL
jgi:Domain of unknown function (DUF4224)